MMTHPPWTRLDVVRQRLRELCTRIAERVVRLLGDGLAEAVRSATQALFLARPRPQPGTLRHDLDPLNDPGRPYGFPDEFDPDESDFDEFDAEDDPLAEPGHDRTAPTTPAAPAEPLWRQALVAGLRGLSWCRIDLPSRRPVLSAVVAAVGLALLGCWLGPAAGVIGAGLSILSVLLPTPGLT